MVCEYLNIYLNKAVTKKHLISHAIPTRKSRGLVTAWKFSHSTELWEAADGIREGMKQVSKYTKDSPLREPRSNDFPVTVSTPSTQIAVSKCHSPLKRTRFLRSKWFENGNWGSRPERLKPKKKREYSKNGRNIIKRHKDQLKGPNLAQFE